MAAIPQVTPFEDKWLKKLWMSKNWNTFTIAHLLSSCWNHSNRLVKKLINVIQCPRQTRLFAWALQMSSTYLRTSCICCQQCSGGIITTELEWAFFHPLHPSSDFFSQVEVAMAVWHRNSVAPNVNYMQNKVHHDKKTLMNSGCLTETQSNLASFW